MSTVDLVYDAVGDSSGRSFITTPTTCTAGGEWTSHITLTTADSQVYRGSAATPCASAQEGVLAAEATGGGASPQTAATMTGLPETGAASPSVTWASWAAVACLLGAALARGRRTSRTR